MEVSRQGSSQMTEEHNRANRDVEIALGLSVDANLTLLLFDAFSFVLSIDPSNLYKNLRHAQNQSWAKESVVKGISLAKKGSFDNAMKCYKHALDIEPNFTQAYVARGAAYVLQGELKKAIAEFEQALKIDPQQQYAITYLQAAKEKLNGRGSHANESGSHAKSTNPHDSTSALSSASNRTLSSYDADRSQTAHSNPSNSADSLISTAPSSSSSSQSSASPTEINPTDTLVLQQQQILQLYGRSERRKDRDSKKARKRDRKEHKKSRKKSHKSDRDRDRARSHKAAKPSNSSHRHGDSRSHSSHKSSSSRQEAQIDELESSEESTDQSDSEVEEISLQPTHTSRYNSTDQSTRDWMDESDDVTIIDPPMANRASTTQSNPLSTDPIPSTSLPSSSPSDSSTSGLPTSISADGLGDWFGHNAAEAAEAAESIESTQSSTIPPSNSIDSSDPPPLGSNSMDVDTTLSVHPTDSPSDGLDLASMPIQPYDPSTITDTNTLFTPPTAELDFNSNDDNNNL